MTTDIASMFGMSPGQLAMKNYRDQQAMNMQYAQLDPFQRASASIGNAGSMMGMMGARAMGMTTAEEDQAKARQGIGQIAAKGDVESLRAAALEANRTGDTTMAFGLYEAAAKQEAAKSRQEYESANTKYLQTKMTEATNKKDDNVGFTPKGKIVFADSFGGGQYIFADRVVDGENVQVKVKYSGPVKTKSVGEGEGGVQKPIVSTDASGNVTVLNAEGTKVLARHEGIGKPTATSEKETNKLTIMEQGLQSIDDALSYLNKGIYTGSYANIQKNAAKLNPLASKKKAENTEAFLASIGNVVIPRLQEFGGSDSNEELKYLQKVTAGEITLEEGSIKKIMNDARTKMNKEIARRKVGKDPTYPSKVADNSPEAKEARYQAWKAKQGIK